MGFLWASLYAHYQLSSGLLTELEGKDVSITGSIVSIPDVDPTRIRFDFAIQTLHFKSEIYPAPKKIRLSWYQAHQPLFKLGQQLELEVRLKKPRNLSNPGGFDYEYWLLQRGIRATGYIRKMQMLSQPTSILTLGGIRQAIYDQLQQYLKSDPEQGLMIALAIGVKNQITQEQWQLLRRTGTSHLMAISGLHIGLVAGFGFFIGRWIWALSGLARYWPAPKAGAINAMLLAFIYAGLAGFSVSTQRALIMLAVVMGALLLQRHTRWSQHLWIALWLVLMINPLAIADRGFWLSFIAVGFILYSMHGRLNMRHWWWRWGRVQWVLTIALLPILLMAFQTVSLVSPLANFLAVPWVSFGVAPFVLLSMPLLTLMPEWSNVLLHLASMSLSALWQVLSFMSQQPFAVWQHAIVAWWVMPLAMLGVSIWFLPRGFSGRWLGGILLLPLWFYPVPRPDRGDVWLSVFDVGQGLSAMIQTQNHVLLYDAGAKFAQFDLGERVVVPALLHAGIKQIDILLISHADNDHAGGAVAVFSALKVKTVMSGEPEKLPSILKADLCSSALHWDWDGVKFDILHPGINHKNYRGNNRSCVLKVVSAYGSVLLTGDIEHEVEANLLQQSIDLQADILIAPHHGSKTSSTAEFITAVKPQHVIFTVGYRNRYHFPNMTVMQRYLSQKAQLWDSATHGAVHIKLTQPKWLLETSRQNMKHYWNQH